MDIIIPIESKEGILRRYFSRAGRLLLEPSRFFRTELNSLDWPEALSFGLIGAWASSCIAFFWETLNSFFLVNFFEKWIQDYFASEEGLSFISSDPQSFVWAAGLVLLTPFLVLLRLLFTSASIYVMARILVEPRPEAPEQVSYSGITRILGVSLTGSWFAVVPIFGGLLSLISRFILTVTGLKERYAISTRRSMMIVLGPWLLLMGLTLILVIIFVALLSQMPLQDLLDLDPGM